MKMRAIGTCSIVLALLPSLASEQETAGGQAATAPTPVEVLAQVNGQPLTVEDYKRYLLFSVGTSLLEEYLDGILLDAEGRRLGISFSYEVLEKKTEEEIQGRLKYFNNSRDEYIAHLKTLGLSYDGEVERIRKETVRRLLLDQCILKTRKITEEQIAGKYEEMHGKKEQKDNREGKKSGEGGEEEKKPLEQVRKEIVQILKTRPPDGAERRAYLENLRKKAKILIAGRNARIRMPESGKPPDDQGKTDSTP